MSRFTAILKGEDGVLVMIESGAKAADNPPAIIWNPDAPQVAGKITFTIVDNLQAVQKWGQWWAIEPRLVDVPGAPETL
jgi:hypothetical protein